jgi:phenylalanyl-tRNA synthetase beta chain
MVDRLARCGQRSVTALVDISNYVMFELGRPSHIFDLDKIHGGLDVRWGKAGRAAQAAQWQHRHGRRRWA